LDTVQSHDRRAPAALALTAKPIALDQRMPGEQAMHGSPQHAFALAVDNPQIPNPTLMADLDVFAHERGDFLGREIVQIQLAVDHHFGGVAINRCRSPSPRRRRQAARAGLAQRWRSLDATFVAANVSLEIAAQPRARARKAELPDLRVSPPRAVDPDLENPTQDLASQAHLDDAQLTKQCGGDEVERKLASFVVFLGLTVERVALGMTTKAHVDAPRTYRQLDPFARLANANLAGCWSQLRVRSRVFGRALAMAAHDRAPTRRDQLLDLGE
jgi:hypothetical protein